LIYEDLVDKKLVQRSKEKGYEDFKWLLYSKDNMLSLSIDVSTTRDGPVSLG
jgi:hypothetical protein